MLYVHPPQSWDHDKWKKITQYPKVDRKIYSNFRFDGWLMIYTEGHEWFDFDIKDEDEDERKKESKKEKVSKSFFKNLFRK